MRGVEVSKLEELRAKTDRQLLVVIRKELERGLVFAGVARTSYHLGDHALARDFLRKAERAYDEANMLLPLVRGTGRVEKTRLEARGRELCEELDELHEFRGGIMRAACC